MRLLSSPLQFGCQLAALAVGVGAVMDSGISEIDLIIPTPNSTYEIGANGRFPVVWAIRNPSLWRGQPQSARLLYYIADVDAPLGSKNENDQSWDILSTQDDTRYLAAEAHLAPNGRYRLIWQVYGTQCNSWRGFENSTDSTSSNSPASKGWNFAFYTKPGGEKADFSLATKANCSERTAVAYNIASAAGSCREFDDVDPFPFPEPCDLKMPDDTIVMNVTKSLDDQFNTSCSEKGYPSYCPPHPKATEKSGSTQSQTGAGILLLGLPLVLLFM